jgi:hypothetical protein
MKSTDLANVNFTFAVSLLSDKDNVTNEWYCDLNRFKWNDENMFPEKSIFSSRFSPSRNCPETSFRHLKLVDLDWTSFENCNGKFNGIDNIEIFRMSGFNCADINRPEFCGAPIAP